MWDVATSTFIGTLDCGCRGYICTEGHLHLILYAFRFLDYIARILDSWIHWGLLVKLEASTRHTIHNKDTDYGFVFVGYTWAVFRSRTEEPGRWKQEKGLVACFALRGAEEFRISD